MQNKLNEESILTRNILKHNEGDIWSDYLYEGELISMTDSLRQNAGDNAMILTKITSDKLSFHALQRSYYNKSPIEKYNDTTIETLPFKDISLIEFKLQVYLDRSMFLVYRPFDYYLRVAITMKDGANYHLQSFSFKPAAILAELAEKNRIKLIDKSSVLELVRCKDSAELETKCEAKFAAL